MDDSGMMSTRERLVYMAEQIARNFAVQSPDQVAEALADHIRQFWDPRMRAQIAGIAEQTPERLSGTVAAAVARLKQQDIPPHISAAGNDGGAGSRDAG